jgi:hypothetical protein
MTPLTPISKDQIQAAYVDEHATTRLRHWRIEKPDGSTSTALLHLVETNRLRDVLRSASPPLLQAVENATRFDSGFNRLYDGTVDTILAQVVANQRIGTLSRDTLGNPVFKPWSKS